MSETGRQACSWPVRVRMDITQYTQTAALIEMQRRNYKEEREKISPGEDRPSIVINTVRLVAHAAVAFGAQCAIMWCAAMYLQTAPQTRTRGPAPLDGSLPDLHPHFEAETGPTGSLAQRGLTSNKQPPARAHEQFCWMICRLPYLSTANRHAIPTTALRLQHHRPPTPLPLPPPPPFPPQAHAKRVYLSLHG